MVLLFCELIMRRRTYLILLLVTIATTFIKAQDNTKGDYYRVTENQQHTFPETIPPGNYSGITWLGGNKYAVVSDKSTTDGFFIFNIDVDSITGEITAAKSNQFLSSGQVNRDGEGIAYNPHSNTIFISGEADNNIKEYDMSGHLTGRVIPPTPLYRHLPGNLGLEALSYNAATHRLWTCNESDSVFIQSYDDSLKMGGTYFYQLDEPIANKSKAQYYAHGIGCITALDDGSLLLLEREFYVPKKKIGAFVNCKLFHIFPQHNKALKVEPQAKKLLLQWKTSLNILRLDIANYEGMCLGPTLKDGSRVLLLVADSQNQYRGVLKDWMKSLTLALDARNGQSYNDVQDKAQ